MILDTFCTNTEDCQTNTPPDSAVYTGWIVHKTPVKMKQGIFSKWNACMAYINVYIICDCKSADLRIKLFKESLNSGSQQFHQ